MLLTLEVDRERVERFSATLHAVDPAHWRAVGTWLLKRSARR